MKQSEIYKQKQDYNSDLARLYSELTFLYGILKGRESFKETIQGKQSPVFSEMIDLYNKEIKEANDKIAQIEAEIKSLQ